MQTCTARALTLAVALSLTSASFIACSGRRPPGKFTQKLVILGFDGLDPHLVTRWMQAGQLPNMAKIASQGGMSALGTTHSPESPTAWASFATGVNPGKHNIYDFLVRDTSTYFPDLGMVRRQPAKFLFNYIPIAKPKVLPLRGGTSFWVTAGREGVRASVLTVPVTFPPEDVPNGELLSGLPLPDIRGTMGTFSYYATDLSRYEEGNTEMGGILKRLVVDKDVATTELIGPPNPVVRQQVEAIRRKGLSLTDADRAAMAELQAREDVRIPFTIRWNRPAKTATVEIEGQSMLLEVGKTSRWIDLDFNVNFFVRLHGMAQMRLMNADKELQLYVSPVNWKPDHPPVPMSAPASFSGDLFERLGYYRTLGWAEATWPLNEGRMDEATFMEDLYRAFDDRAQVILNRIDAHDWDVLVGVIESTDRVQHMMWRLIDEKHPMYDSAMAAKFGDSILEVYRRADQFVGEVVQRLEPGTQVLIVSDHGFHSWRKAVNLNTWLVQQGYMTLQGQQPGDKKLDDLFGGGTFWENVDWSHTRAYAMGIGQIYFNLRGREARGIVSPGAESKQLADELSARLLTMKDPDDGAPIIRAVYKRDDVYSGEYLENASELQVGMEDGYRVSWQTTLGGSPQGIVYPNMKKWSGDHGGYDYATTAGVLISSRPLTGQSPSIVDIAPTVLKYFGLSIPKDIDGKPLY
ncbi:MAG TPA: alkaline phosphatase family protein [Vicinamibacterales bacterium]|jgi:predicted AlkP superfamily phosphohydrolase/phosphomutase|nr:alkaline phosphatase family protein [Vicinamibacterales bacterium]